MGTGVPDAAAASADTTTVVALDSLCVPELDANAVLAFVSLDAARTFLEVLHPVLTVYGVDLATMAEESALILFVSRGVETNCVARRVWSELKAAYTFRTNLTD